MFRRARSFRTHLSVLFLSMLASTAWAQTGVIQSTGGGGPWSVAATWSRISGTGLTPTVGDHVIINTNDVVQLDTNTGIQNLAHLDVSGSLIFQNTGVTYSMGVSRIDVNNGGLFQIGTNAQRYTGSVVLTLTDNWLSSVWGNPLENKSFIVRGGATLELHGDDAAGSKASWGKLQNLGNLVVGDTSLTMSSAPGWSPQDQIVIASTDFDMNQAEVVTVTQVNGSTVTFNPPLAFNHHGTIESGIIDERAEVGLLTRNIVIQGDPATSNNTTRRGGHLMMMGTTPSPPVTHIEWVEFRKMGWHGALGRYPVHFHLIGNVPGSYVRDCSVHDCYFRAVTVHGTNQALIQNNVAYDTWGHTYYLEDGNEVLNVFHQNLGLGTKTPDPAWAGLTLLGQTWPLTGQPFFGINDDEPSTFWITHADNTIWDNVAAGSEGHGFWYHFELPYGGGPGYPVVPLRFERNTAHSNGIHGFFQEDHRMVTVDTSLPNMFDGSSDMIDFTAYKNRRSGVWHRCYGVTRWIRAKLADNRFGFYLASEGFQQDYQNYITPYLSLGPPFQYFNSSFTGCPGFSLQIVEDCDILGETNNLGNPTHANELGWMPPRSLPDPTNPQLILKGVELYDGLIEIVGSRFRDFRDAQLPTPVTKPGGTYSWRASTGISTRGDHSVWVPGNPWGVDPRNVILTSTFTNVTHPVLFPIPHAPTAIAGANGVESSLIYDVDGSIGGPPNTYYANNTPLLRPAGIPAPVPLPPFTHYAAPMVIPGPGTVRDFAYGQIQINIGGLQAPPSVAWNNSWNTNPNTQGLTHVTLTSITRPGQATSVYDPQQLQVLFGRHPISLLMNHGTTNEEYALSYPTGHNPQDDPRNLEVRLKFSESGRHILLDIPYDGSAVGTGPPNQVLFTNDMIAPTTVPGIPVGSKAAVLAGSGLEYHYDATAKRLYIRPTLWAGTGYLPILAGREVLVQIQH